MTDFIYLPEALIGAAMLLLGTTALARPALLARAIGWLPGRRIARLPFALLSALAGAALLAGLAVPLLVFFAAALTIVVLAAFWLLPAALGRGRRRSALAPLGLIAATLGLALAQPLGLKVLLLPAADTLPYAPAPARVVKTYEAGVGFESVRAGPDGTLYLAANRGLDFNRADYYRHAQGQIIERRADGGERVLFTTPLGATAGVMAIAADGTLYMSSNGRSPAIWRVTPHGAAALLARLPAGAWPNGLDFGPDGMLYAADSARAAIWRIDPATGQFAEVVRDAALAARRFVALAPGANGLHFVGRDMIVTVSDAARVLRFTPGADGRFGRPVTIATGIPGDDFAVAGDGTIYVTTHPYDTLVRIAPDGRRSVIGDARQHIVGATDATIGRGPHDRDTLYVATDGGAFTRGAGARGQLVALDIAGHR